MQAIISARGLSISKTYKDTLTQRLAKLEPMFPGIVEAKIVLSKEKHRRTAALTLVAKRHTFRSEETAADLETAVDVAVDALARQVREMKDRVKNRKARSAPRRAPAPTRAAESPTAEVAVMRVPLELMPLAAAVEQLRASRDEFLVFANATTDVVSVLYRRGDGGFGLIEPVA
jgi:putative sigma-54 modulation protein